MQAQAQQTSEDYSDWMAYLPDNAYLSQVSIPGSHDACTMYGSHYRVQEAGCPAKGTTSNGCRTSYSAT